MRYLLFTSFNDEIQHKKTLLSILSFYYKLKENWNDYKVVVYTDDVVFFKGIFKSWIYIEASNATDIDSIINDFYKYYSGNGIYFKSGIIFQNSASGFFQELEESRQVVLKKQEDLLVYAFDENKLLLPSGKLPEVFVVPRHEVVMKVLEELFSKAYYFDFSELIKFAGKLSEEISMK